VNNWNLCLNINLLLGQRNNKESKTQSLRKNSFPQQEHVVAESANLLKQLHLLKIRDRPNRQTKVIKGKLKYYTRVMLMDNVKTHTRMMPTLSQAIMEITTSLSSTILAAKEKKMTMIFLLHLLVLRD